MPLSKYPENSQKKIKDFGIGFSGLWNPVFLTQGTIAQGTKINGTKENMFLEIDQIFPSQDIAG